MLTVKKAKRKTFFRTDAALLFLAAVFAGCSEKPGDPGADAVQKYASVDEGNKNMPCPGIIMAEFGDSPAGSDISKLVDGDPATAFVTFRSDFDITFTGNSGSVVQEYSITAASGSPENAPSSWTLKGSNDDKKWSVIDTRKGESFSAGEKKVWRIEGPESYKSYRLDITSNGGGPSTSVAEWVMSAEEVSELRVKIYEMPELAGVISLSDSNGWSYSDATPMGKHYAAGSCPVTEATPEQLKWLADASTDVEIPTSAAGLGTDVSWSVPTFKLYPSGDPRPSDVNQHGIGDCCLCAVFASMAYIYPDFIKSVIKSKGNDIYDIAMFDPMGKPITVQVNTTCIMNSKGDIVAMSGKDNVATWGTLLEKAVMKWNCVFRKSPSLGGIGTEIVPCLFTGDGGSIAFDRGKLTAGQMDKVVDDLLDYGVLVIGGFNPGGLQINDKGYETVSAHAFTFMYSPDPDAMFIMRNPWGNNTDKGGVDGAMDIYDDGIIPPTIDLRVCEPGIAAKYKKNPLLPYIPKQNYSAGSFWLTPEMMRQHGL